MSGGFISKGDRRQAGSDARWIIMWGIGITILISILVLVLNFAGLIFKGQLLDRENEVRRNSYQFEGSARSYVTDKIEAYQDLTVDIDTLRASGGDESVLNDKTAQLKATLDQICNKAGEVQLDDLTDNAQIFVRQNCN